MTRWLRLLSRAERWLSDFDTALAAVPDPHGQFHSVPIVWCLPRRDPRATEWRHDDHEH
jgi:hypothetical protein